jgi:hypothetical protein
MNASQTSLNKKNLEVNYKPLAYPGETKSFYLLFNYYDTMPKPIKYPGKIGKRKGFVESFICKSCNKEFIYKGSFLRHKEMCNT